MQRTVIPARGYWPIGKEPGGLAASDLAAAVDAAEANSTSRRLAVTALGEFLAAAAAARTDRHRDRFRSSPAQACTSRSMRTGPAGGLGRRYRGHRCRGVDRRSRVLLLRVGPGVRRRAQQAPDPEADYALEARHQRAYDRPTYGGHRDGIHGWPAGRCVIGAAGAVAYSVRTGAICARSPTRPVPRSERSCEPRPRRAGNADRDPRDAAPVAGRGGHRTGPIDSRQIEQRSRRRAADGRRCRRPRCRRRGSRDGRRRGRGCRDAAEKTIEDAERRRRRA